MTTAIQSNYLSDILKNDFHCVLENKRLIHLFLSQTRCTLCSSNMKISILLPPFITIMICRRDVSFAHMHWLCSGSHLFDLKMLIFQTLAARIFNCCVCCYENHRLWWLNSDENRGKILPIMRMEDMHVFSQYQRTVFAICVMIELFVFRQPHCRNKNYSFCVIQRDTRLLHINWTNVFTCTRMVREPTHCTWAYCEVMAEWTWLRHSKLSRQRYKCECHQHNINQ